MVAAVETMMYAGDVPWHGLGEYVGDEDVKSGEAIRMAGLDWQVEKRELLTVDGVPVDEAKAIVRMSDDAVLGVVGNKYVPVQNVESFEFMDSLIEQGEMRYHTAGSLREGKQIWLLGKIHGTFEPVKGDPVDKFLLLANSHDGTGALRVFFTTVRVVCANTLALANKEGKGQGVSIRHTKNIKDRIEEAKNVLGLAQKNMQKYQEFTEKLAQISMMTTDWNDFNEFLFPIPDFSPGTKEDVVQRVTTRAQNQRDEMTNLFENGIGADIPGVSGTAWQALNAVTEYTNYHKASRGGQARRFEGLISGSGHVMNQRAVGYLEGLI